MCLGRPFGGEPDRGPLDCTTDAETRPECGGVCWAASKVAHPFRFERSCGEGAGGGNIARASSRTDSERGNGCVWSATES